jgi:hypothetical protein
MFTNLNQYDPTFELRNFLINNSLLSRVTFAGDLKKGYEGRPLVREWFIQGFRLAPPGFLCFLNGDIFITPEWLKTALSIFEVFDGEAFTKTMVFGTRTDVSRSSGILELPVESPTFINDVVEYLEAHVKGNNRFGMDLVFFSSSFDGLDWNQLPDFVVGMCIWDNFFMAWANAQCNTVTMNFQARMFHMDHAPNACNEENSGYFRAMSARSPAFRGFHEHWKASWAVAPRRLGVFSHRGEDGIRFR